MIIPKADRRTIYENLFKGPSPLVHAALARETVHTGS